LKILLSGQKTDPELNDCSLLLSVGEVLEVLGKNHSITKPNQDCHGKIVRRVNWAALI